MPGEALVYFGRLLSNVHMHWTFITRDDFRQTPERRFGNSTQAVRADPHRGVAICGFACIFIVIDELVRRHRESALCHCGLRLIEAGALVENGHVSQPDTGIRGGRLNRLKHRAPLLSAGRLTVQVMKLRYRCIANGQHLGIGLAGDGGESVRIDQSGKPVHLLAPAPESVPDSRPSLLGMTGKRPLKRMTMGVRDAWNHYTGYKIVRIDAAANLDGLNQPVDDSQSNIVGPACMQERFFRQDRRHQATCPRLYIQLSPC